MKVWIFQAVPMTMTNHSWAVRLFQSCQDTCVPCLSPASTSTLSCTVLRNILWKVNSYGTKEIPDCGNLVRQDWVETWGGTIQNRMSHLGGSIRNRLCNSGRPYGSDSLKGVWIYRNVTHWQNFQNCVEQFFFLYILQLKNFHLPF